MGKKGKVMEAGQLLYIFDPLVDKCILGQQFFADQRSTLYSDTTYRRGALIMGDSETPRQHIKESDTFAVDPLMIPARMSKQVELTIPFAEEGDCGVLSNDHGDATTLPWLPEGEQGMVGKGRRLVTWITNLTNIKIVVEANTVIGAFSKQASKEGKQASRLLVDPINNKQHVGWLGKLSSSMLSQKKRGDRDEDKDIV